jgi:hypothetical protein
LGGHPAKGETMSKEKLFVLQNADTIANGIAGCQIRTIEGKEWVDGDLILTVLVVDMDGGLAGPYKIPQSQTEVR